MPEFGFLIIVAVVFFIFSRVGKAMKGGFQSVLDQLEHAGGIHGQGTGFRRPGQPIGPPGQQRVHRAVPTRPPGVGQPPVPGRRPPGRPASASPIAGGAAAMHGLLPPPMASTIPKEIVDPHAIDDLGPSLAAAGSTRRREDREARRAKKASGAIRFVRSLQGADAETLRGAIVLADVLGPPVAIRSTEDRLAEWK